MGLAVFTVLLSVAALVSLAFSLLVLEAGAGCALATATIKVTPSVSETMRSKLLIVVFIPSILW